MRLIVYELCYRLKSVTVEVVLVLHFFLTAQCNATSCDRGRCQETIENTTCICEPGFKGDRCQTGEEKVL